MWSGWCGLGTGWASGEARRVGGGWDFRGVVRGLRLFFFVGVCGQVGPGAELGGARRGGGDPWVSGARVGGRGRRAPGEGIGAEAGANSPGRELGGGAGRGGSGAAGMGRCSAGRSRGPGIGVRECAVGSGTAESGTDSSFPTPWRLAGAEGRENRGASLWFLFHPRSRGMAFVKVCPSKSADPCAPCPSHSTALSCRAVGEVRSGCRRSFRGVLGRCGRPRPARPLGRPGEDLPLEMRSPLPSQPAAGREEGSKDHGRARRTTAGLEGPRQGSKDHGRASNGPPPGIKRPTTGHQTAHHRARRRAAGLRAPRGGGLWDPRWKEAEGVRPWAHRRPPAPVPRR